jgi:hypothetical protein
MKIMSLWLFARIAAAISVVFLVSIATLNKGQVLAQLANVRSWVCGNGAGKEILRPTSAVWDPDAERMIIATNNFGGSSGYNYLVSWDVTKQPNTACAAIAFDGTNSDPTESSVDRFVENDKERMRVEEKL